MDRKERITQLVDEKLPAFTKVSDEIWGYAELCYKEYQSCDCQIKEMERQGFRIERNIAGIETAFIASYGEGHPIVAVLGEYDALAGLNQEADNIHRNSFKPGEPGHGCGHNLLGAASMSAVTAIKEYMQENNLKGTIRYYGCPAEEGGSAKTFMVRDGYFKDVDIALSWHPSQFNYVWDGEDCLGTYNIIFHYKGIAAHAAACPQLGRSALDAVELLNIGVQFLREHIIPEGRIHYAILNSGGTAPNVVQAEAEVSYVIRAPKMADMYDIADRVIRIAEGAAMMTDTTMTKRVVSGTSNLLATKAVFDRYDANLRSFLPVPYTEDELAYAKKFKDSLDVSDRKRMINCLRADYPGKSLKELEEMLDMPMANYICRETGNTASTDAGDVTWVVPGCQLHVACYPAGTPFHSWQMTAMGKSPLAHRSMGIAAKVIAMTALDFILDEKLVQQAKADFIEKLEGQTYRCPLPMDLKPGGH